MNPENSKYTLEAVDGGHENRFVLKADDSDGAVVSLTSDSGTLPAAFNSQDDAVWFMNTVIENSENAESGDSAITVAPGASLTVVPASDALAAEDAAYVVTPA